MNWYQYVAGFIVTSFAIGLFIGIAACGLWLQGWLAGRRYYNADRKWGRMAGRLWYGPVPSATGEDRRVEFHPDCTLRFERPNGEVVGSQIPGHTSDGQSVPVLAWPLIGSPFTGRSRDIATGIHDPMCKERTRPSAEVHGIFYEAMRSRGIWFRGPIIHAVELNWGPKW